MKVEQNQPRIPDSFFGTDEKKKIDGAVKQPAKESTEKTSSESKDRTDIQHQVVGHEAKKEVSQQSQSKAAELTSKLGDGKSKVPFSEITEILHPKSTHETHSVPDTRKNEVQIGGQLRAAQLHSQIETSHVAGENKMSLVDQTKNGMRQFASKVSDGAKDLKETAEKLVQSGELSRPLDLKDVKGMASKAGEEVENVKLDPGKEIDNMKDGDKITVGGGVSVAASGGAKVGGKGNIELTKEGDKYKLSVDGEIAASVVADIGGGGKAEMTFNSAEEAKKAFGLVQAARLKDAATSENLQAGGLTAKEAINFGKDAANKMTSTKDAEFLKKHLSAVEVRQSWIAEVPGMSVGHFGHPASATAKAETTVRVEYKNGEPQCMILKNAAVGESYPGGKSSISVEQKIPIDKDFPIGKLTSREMKNDPLSDLTEKEKQSYKNAMDNAEYSVTVEGDLRYQGGDKGTGVRSQIKLTGKAKDFEKPETQKAIRGMVQEGKIKEGLKAVGDNVTVEGKIEAYESSGVEIKSPEIVVGVEFQATKQRSLGSTTIPKPGTTKTATQAAEDFDKAYQEANAKAKSE